MGTKSKFFRVFVAGQTISDGRTITPEMIDEIVETFHAETYTPRINIEHIAGFSPEPPFNGYGDIVAVRAQDDSFTIAGKTEKRRALYAQVEANDQLVALVAKDQKPFPSVELTGDYAGTGKVGLVGLAFTDKPASIGTERLQFARRAPGTVFASADDPVAIEFEAAPADATGIAAAITQGLAGFFARFTPAPKDPEPAPPQPANDNAQLKDFADAFGAQVGAQIAAAVKPATDGLAALQAEFTTLKAQLAETPQPLAPQYRRAPATGGTGGLVTDC